MFLDNRLNHAVDAIQAAVKMNSSDQSNAGHDTQTKNGPVENKVEHGWTSKAKRGLKDGTVATSVEFPESGKRGQKGTDKTGHNMT